ncbi:MAG TPA: histidine phosphatase family protein [Anaeromyxobacteraceae bacterium]|nr:histidine phosphatase family protein [Anaeromyxobacteraceae bacterium]
MATTKRVYLVRHGAAESIGKGGDASRRLTAEGRASFESLVRVLAPRLSIERVWTSPAVRARESADILATATRAEIHVTSELAAGHSSGPELLALARKLGPGSALVGHNPEVGEAIALAGGVAQNVKAGAVAALEFTPEGFALAFLEAPLPGG